MRKLLNVTVFGGVAVGLHMAAFGLRPDQGEAASAGDGGRDLVAIAAASAAYAEMARQWETPPDVSPSPEAVVAPALPEPPDTPDSTQDHAPQRPTLPHMAALQAQAPRLPNVDTAPPARTKHAAKPPPPKAKPSAPSRPAVQQKAAGSGGKTSAGEHQTAKAATLSKAKRTSIMAQWGATIRAHIDQAKRAPRGAGEGAVTLSVRVMANGALHGVSVRRSSGNAALDTAAVAAVKRARRFPAAPKGLDGKSFGFTLQIRFSG